MREHFLIHIQVHYMQHIDHSPLGKGNPGESDNYYKIARHYGWGFKQVLCVCVCDTRYSWAIVLEHDFEVSFDTVWVSFRRFSQTRAIHGR